MRLPVVAMVKEVDSVKITFVGVKVVLSKWAYIHFSIFHMPTCFFRVGELAWHKGIRWEILVRQVPWGRFEFTVSHSPSIEKSNC
jgi:hypothetical protein